MNTKHYTVPQYTICDDGNQHTGDINQEHMALELVGEDRNTKGKRPGGAIGWIRRARQASPDGTRSGWGGAEADLCDAFVSPERTTGGRWTSRPRAAGSGRMRTTGGTEASGGWEGVETGWRRPGGAQT